MQGNRLLVVRETKLMYDVYHKTTVYKDHYKTFAPFEPIHKRAAGWEYNEMYSTAPPDWVNKTKRGDSVNKEENQRRAGQRAKSEARDLIQYNELKQLFTFTFDTKLDFDVFDDELVKKKMLNWFNYQRKKHPDMGYVCVPERHEKGNLHFHAAISAFPEIEPSINAKYGGQHRDKHGNLHWHTPSWKYGWSDMKEFPELWMAASYITKYLTKTFEEGQAASADKKRYWASRNLQRPPKIENAPFFDPLAPPEGAKVYESKMGKTYIYGKA